MNHYYLEKMLETKQRELDRLSKEAWKLTSIKRKKSVFNNLFIGLFFAKSKNQSEQACCA
jgi:hypothetical protein